MPTKILVLETPTFQLGANAGSEAEKLEPADFAARLQKHFKETGTDLLFVIAPDEVRFSGIFNDASSGPGNVSLAFFPKVEDAIRFLPSIFLFANDARTTGVKNCLAKGSTIYSASFFNGNSVGSKLDPTFAFARRNLSPLAATNAWGSIQSLVFHGLQSLPDQGEKGTGEKVDVQIGADEKVVALTVRFDLVPEKMALSRSSPMLALSRSSSGVFESRYLADGKKMEFNCLFFRENGPDRPIEISSFQSVSALENAETTKDLIFKDFGSLEGAVTEEKRVISGGKGGFRKKFSAQVSADAPIEEPITVISPEKTAPTSTVVVSGSASLAGAKETIIKGGPTNPELETKIKLLETALKAKDETINKLNKELTTVHDPHSKRDVITSIKDSQSDALKQNIKVLEAEIEEAKGREKELMKMVDKAVQMKDEAAKRIKELDMKLKQASGGKGSKEQMLEKQLEEAKRQNKELAARIGDLMTKLKGGKAA